MGRPSRRGLLAAALLLLFIFSAAGSLGASATRTGRRSSGALKEGEKYWWDQAAAGRRRELVGPGSSPPTCRSRCGGCRPCWPVHVAIQPGVSFPLEYYPEAWRCKCGDRLFMP